MVADINSARRSNRLHVLVLITKMFETCIHPARRERTGSPDQIHMLLVLHSRCRSSNAVPTPFRQAEPCRPGLSHQQLKPKTLLRQLGMG
jgi:hypothetical protein